MAPNYQSRTRCFDFAYLNLNPSPSGHCFRKNEYQRVIFLSDILIASLCLSKLYCGLELLYNLTIESNMTFDQCPVLCHRYVYLIKIKTSNHVICMGYFNLSLMRLILALALFYNLAWILILNQNDERWPTFIIRC